MKHIGILVVVVIATLPLSGCDESVSGEEDVLLSEGGAPFAGSGAEEEPAVGSGGEPVTRGTSGGSSGSQIPTRVACGTPGESCEDGDPCTSGDTAQDLPPGGP